MKRTARYVVLTLVASSAILSGTTTTASAASDPCSYFYTYWCGYSVARTTLPRKQENLGSLGSFARDIDSRSIAKTAGGSNQWSTGYSNTVGMNYGWVTGPVYCDIGASDSPGGIKIGCQRDI